MIKTTRLSPAEQEVYRQATEMLARDVDAAAFSSRFFGPKGELRGLATNREERRQILGTELYRWLKAEYTRLRQEDTEQFEKDLKTGPGRLTVVVPRSLHTALKSEASGEGVSLSELIRLKLTMPYRQMTSLLG
jgi:predicted HicB family RNase H-like nuclease